MEIFKTLLAGVGVFAIAFWLVYIACSIGSQIKNRRSNGKPVSEQTAQSNQSPFRIGTMDLILIIMGISLLLFTCKMISLFETYMAVPDTLITCVFGLCGGECGILGFIKTSKERNKERRWQLEDMERMKRDSEKNGHQ